MDFGEVDKISCGMEIIFTTKVLDLRGGVWLMKNVTEEILRNTKYKCLKEAYERNMLDIYISENFVYVKTPYKNYVRSIALTETRRVFKNLDLALLVD